MKILDNRLFNAIEEEAKASPRRRMSHDLRTQAMDEEPDWRDSSQRMLNVMMTDIRRRQRHSSYCEGVGMR